MRGWGGLEFFAKFAEDGRIATEVVADYAEDRGGWLRAGADEAFELASKRGFCSAEWGEDVGCQKLVEHDLV